MVLYPVPRLMARVVNAMLSFVNKHTRDKFIITDDLVLVCKGKFNMLCFLVRCVHTSTFPLNYSISAKELGWNLQEIETSGSVNAYMEKHVKHSFVLD